MAHILVVENERTIRFLITRILLRMGHYVTEADNGVSALAIVEKQLPDLVLTDLHMPRMDGLKLIEHLHEDFPTLPIVVVSIYTERVSEALQKGAQYYLNKPFSFQQLTSFIQQLTPLPEYSISL
jgi:CheY-like chemotaxis protein